MLNRLGHLGIIIKIIPVSKLPVLILLIIPGVLDVSLLFRFQKDLVRIDQAKFFLRCLFDVAVRLDIETFLFQFCRTFLFRGNLFDQDLNEIMSTNKAREIYTGFSQKKALEPLCRRCGYARRFT